ncbi:hypothetical protein GCM10009827_055580 [Dactylosporangium maewongense]|uniref:Uncharacterized protein n=1 Tax=Dactylosporangium maewongense TaxID=634393 RepID=A0ABP4LSM9_9ACTN
MGVMMDYFAATEQELAALDLDLGPAGNDWPYVDCKGWILEVEEFAAEIDGRDPSEFGRDEPLRGADDPEFLGPWTVRINAELVDALTRLEEGQIRGYADRFLLEDWEAGRLVALAGLARSAVAQGRALYSWSSV